MVRCELAAFVGADDAWAECVDAAAMEADDVLLAEDGVAEDGVGCRVHRQWAALARRPCQRNSLE